MVLVRLRSGYLGPKKNLENLRSEFDGLLKEYEIVTGEEASPKLYQNHGFGNLDKLTSTEYAASGVGTTYTVLKSHCE